MGEGFVSGRKYPLLFEYGDVAAIADIAVPIPIDELIGRSSIDFKTLAAHAMDHTPPDYPEVMQEIDDAMTSLERRPSTHPLSVLGPEEGDYYVVLPRPEPKN